MKIIKNNQEINLYDKIIEAEIILKSKDIFILESSDHTDHIAAYIAWNNVGGNIFVKSPLLPIEQSHKLDEEIRNRKFSNSIIFHTSGTTGIPKLVIHTSKQMLQSVKMSTECLGWDNNTTYLNFIPAFTSGFWHIVNAPLFYYNCKIILGSRETAEKDFTNDANCILIVPAFIDYLRINKIKLDFSKFRKVGVGGSQVLKRHAEYCFNNGAKTFAHLYGQTETCSPILGRETDVLDDYVEYINLKSKADTKSKIVDKELWIKGHSICENKDEFNTEDGWIKTGDLWEQQGELIKFIGRKNDMVKINGYFCSLVLIENIAETETDLGETIAIARNSLGSDWIELFYTNKNVVIDKKYLTEIYISKVPKCNIPLKYTYVESIPKNSLGKKIRNVF